MIRITCSPMLVEEAVLLAERTMTAADRRAFRCERDPLYGEHSPDRRDELFHRLHERWFRRLGLYEPIEECVGEQPNLRERLQEARVLPATTAREEGADLVDRLALDDRDRTPLLAIRLRPSTILHAQTLRQLLRHELLHVEDMLDPAFGYERSLAPSDLGPIGDNLVQARYRVAWNATIDGRLSRAGCADAGAVKAHRKEFSAAFAMLGPFVDSACERWFNLEHPTHAALAAFARTPAFDPCEVQNEQTNCVTRS